MVVSKEYGAEWGLKATKDGEEVDFLSLDLSAGTLVDAEGVEHPLSDFKIEGLDHFALMHGE